jgi:NTF2 fold immunity protein
LCHLDGRQKEWREHQTAENHSLNVAVKVGEAVLMPAYGEKRIAGERPFKATLQGDVWTVEGTLHCDGPPGETCLGGTAIVKISKTSGTILFMLHHK